MGALMFLAGLIIGGAAMFVACCLVLAKYAAQRGTRDVLTEMAMADTRAKALAAGRFVEPPAPGAERTVH